MIFSPLHDSASNAEKKIADRDCIQPPRPPVPRSQRVPCISMNCLNVFRSVFCFAMDSSKNGLLFGHVLWIGMMYPGLNIQKDGEKRGKPMVCLGKWSRNNGFSIFMLVLQRVSLDGPWSRNWRATGSHGSAVSCSSATNRRSRDGCSTRFILGNIKKTKVTFSVATWVERTILWTCETRG